MLSPAAPKRSRGAGALEGEGDGLSPARAERKAGGPCDRSSAFSAPALDLHPRHDREGPSMPATADGLQCLGTMDAPLPTFDDGPSESTAEILDLLADYG